MKAFRVIVKDTQNVVFDGDVDRISSYNEVGPFDIYPMHANFISILRQELTLYLHKQKVKELKFEQAILKVKQDKAQIFIGIEVLFMDEASNTVNSQK